MLLILYYVMKGKLHMIRTTTLPETSTLSLVCPHFTHASNNPTAVLVSCSVLEKIVLVQLPFEAAYLSSVLLFLILTPRY